MLVNVRLSVSWLCLVKRRRKLGGYVQDPPLTVRDTAVWLKLYDSNSLDFPSSVMWPQPPLGSSFSFQNFVWRWWFWSDSRASSVQHLTTVPHVPHRAAGLLTLHLWRPATIATQTKRSFFDFRSSYFPVSCGRISSQLWSDWLFIDWRNWKWPQRTESWRNLLSNCWND